MVKLDELLNKPEPQEEKANWNKKFDRNNVECYTPKYAVDIIIPFLDKDKVYWAPFDLESSNFVRYLREKGFKVINSHIFNGQDFLTYEPEEHWDAILSNPPFKGKKVWLDRAMELGKPFAFLLPATWINDMNFNEIYENTNEQLRLILPNRRISFDGTKKTPTFKSCFWTYGYDKVQKTITSVYIETRAEEIPMYEEVQNMLNSQEVDNDSNK